LADKVQSVKAENRADQMRALMQRLFPICRSITGDGVRETLRILREHIPLEICEVPTGTQVFDWTVPREWNIKDGWIKDSAGKRLIDFQRLNLHVVSYSVPVHQRMRLAELREHLHTVPHQPGWVPYRTSYYKESWGFCVSENQLAQLNDTEEYDVCIDSSLASGHLSYGEYLLKGKEAGEVLISCHICHPSLANDNLSGIAVAVELAQHLASTPRRYSYRFLFIPGTIGSITWLSRNEDAIGNIRHGFVLTCVGDAGNTTYKRSRRGDAEIDRAFIHVLKQSGEAHRVIEFSPYGYDERQYCSPAFNLPVGVIMRTPHGEFAQYHTSADGLDFVQADALSDSLSKCCKVIDVLEFNRVYVNLKPKCEPQLGRRGLYGAIGGETNKKDWEMAILWVLNLSDGNSSLLDIAERSGLPFSLVRSATDALVRQNLLKEVSPKAVT
jgi:aminopeptidase-like protein